MGLNGFADVGAGLVLCVALGIAALQGRADRKDAAILVLLIYNGEAILFHASVLAVILMRNGAASKLRIAESERKKSQR
jgi:hypothetical protein